MGSNHTFLRVGNLHGFVHEFQFDHLGFLFKKYILYVVCGHAERRSSAIKFTTILILICFVKWFVVCALLSELFIYLQFHWRFRSFVF